MIPTDLSWRLLEAGVDYWSGTTDDKETGEWAYERARDYVECDRRGAFAGAGATVQGYTGVMSEHTFTGRSDSGTYVRFSSTDARDRWCDFSNRGLRASRIDVAVTLAASYDIPSLAHSIRYDPRLPASLRGVAPRLGFVSYETLGDTAYIGSAGSDRRGRIYDKNRESTGDYPVGSWRWEVQLRHKPAAAIGSHLSSRDKHPEWITAFVQQWFSDRGIYAPWTPTEAFTAPFSAGVASDDARRMQWLRTSVAPLVRKLSERYGVHELRKALGVLYDPNETIRTRLTR